MASPNQVVLLRTGDATLKVGGEIRRPGVLYDIIALAAQSAWHGELVVFAESGTRSIFFDRGTVIGAATNVEEERIGEILYRFGVLTREQLDHIVTASNRSGKRLGESAIELEFVSAGDLYPMMARQVEEVFYGALQVSEGSFFFFDRFDERSVLNRQNLNAIGLLMEGARRVDEMRYFKEKIPNGTFIPVPAHGKRPPDELLSVFEQCDGRRSVIEIGRSIGQLEFEVTRAVFQLTNGGYVHLTAPKPQGPEAIVDVFNPALGAIHARCDAAGKGAELREGLSRFATGGGVYDPLFMGAGPSPEGTLSGERVARNLVALGGEDPDAWLVDLIDEYANFALFQAESLLGREAATELTAVVKKHLAPLRPPEDRPSKIP